MSRRRAQRHSLTHGERVGVRGYTLSIIRTPSPGAARRPLPTGEVKRREIPFWRYLSLALPISLFMAGAPAQAETLPSGTTFLTDNLKRQQADEAANPGMLWVGEGAQIWDTAQGEAGKSCAACHGQAEASMKGVAARYPAVDGRTGRLLNLEGRINNCRTEHQQAKPYAYESEELLAITAFVARQSLGMPMHIETGGAAAPFYQAGKAFFYQREGQLNLACAHCHENNAGRTLRGDTISYGLGNGYPAYRIEWQSLGSLHRRLRACSYGVRAIQFDYGSPEYVSLELYLAKRAEGVAIETPAIRK
jgi:L-cysteine S-thiosulfotransferase